MPEFAAIFFAGIFLFGVVAIIVDKYRSKRDQQIRRAMPSSYREAH